MSTQGDPFRVVFVEEDNLFRLMEVALNRDLNPQAERTLHYFYGDDISQPLERLRAMPQQLGLPAHLEGVVVDAAAAVDAALREADVVVTEKALLDRRRLGLVARRARLVQKFGRDVDNIDVDAAHELGVVVANLKRFSTASSADNILALILALARNLLAADRSVRARRNKDLPGAWAEGPAVAKFNWSGISGIRVLATQTLGMIGLGENAGAAAQRARAFGMRVLYTKRTRLAEHEETRLGVEWRERDDLLRESDFVSLHVPYGPETEKMVDARFLELMKPGSFLLNTSRGGIVDERALWASLDSGHLAGAALDVFRYEPVPADSPLLDLENVVWTPHMSGGEPDFMLVEVEDVLANVARVWRGETPRGLISS